MTDSPAARKILRQFFDGPQRNSKHLTYHQLQGFLFALAAGPDLVMPSEWMPLVFGADGAEYENFAEAKRVMSALMTLYNEITLNVRENRAALPDDCPWRVDVVANLDPEAPISQWSVGVLRGHVWLHESWDDLLPKEAVPEFDQLFLALTFFASKEATEEYANEMRADLIALATTARNALASAILDYCRIGRLLEEPLRKPPAEAAPQARREPKISRNEPCPCGSGRKYKKCCGAATSH